MLFSAFTLAHTLRGSPRPWSASRRQYNDVQGYIGSGKAPEGTGRREHPPTFKSWSTCPGPQNATANRLYLRLPLGASVDTLLGRSGRATLALAPQTPNGRPLCAVGSYCKPTGSRMIMQWPLRGAPAQYETVTKQIDC